MARGKNRNRLFGRRSRSSNSAAAATIITRSPLLRFPPDKKKPSKTINHNGYEHVFLTNKEFFKLNKPNNELI